MKREDLKNLGLEKEVIDKVMDLHQVDAESNKVALKSKDDEITTLSGTVKDLTDKVSKFDGVDPDKFKKEVKDWEDKYNKDVADLKKTNAINLAITKAKPKNEKALMALLDTEIIKLNEDGTVVGLQEQLENVKKENAFLFEDEKANPTDVNLGGNHNGDNPKNDDAVTLEGAIAAHYTQQE